MQKEHYLDRNPVKGKAIAKGCGTLFSIYADKINIALGTNHGGHKISLVVRIKDFTGKNHQSLIFLN